MSTLLSPNFYAECGGIELFGKLRCWGMQLSLKRRGRQHDDECLVVWTGNKEEALSLCEHAKCLGIFPAQFQLKSALSLPPTCFSIDPNRFFVNFAMGPSVDNVQEIKLTCEEFSNLVLSTEQFFGS